MTLLALCLLAGSIVDSAFAGYRDAGGRDAHIFKAEYYRRSLRRGVRHGLGVLGLAALWAVLVLGGRVALGSSLASELAALERCAQAMVPIIAVYATVVLAALAMWAAADADLRTLASVIVLGPFTLLRPWVIVAAGVAGLWASTSPGASWVVIVACGLQLGVEPWLGLGWRGGRRPLD